MPQYNRVFVLDADKQPLSPCHPARARELLRLGRASVLRRYPFTIILNRVVPDANPAAVEMKIDPGSKATGIALVQNGRVVWAAELEHRGQQIRDALLKRRQLRRGRRSRKTRYRQPRFENRTRPKDWLPPSLKSRVDNVQTWFVRLFNRCPITSLSMELVKCDTQMMENPEISGVEYQQGQLVGYEVREYLLEKWGRKCAYCKAENVPLQIEHIVSRAKGGSDRVSNLTIACVRCNQRKGAMSAAEFGHPEIQRRAKQPLKDAAAVNATRWALWCRLSETGLALETGSGGRTKYNRRKQEYPKAHWIDAACVGESGAHVKLDPTLTPLTLKATGRQSRQMCRPDKYGFPRTASKQSRMVKGFQTGDMVKAVVPPGLKTSGTHVGRVAVRKSGTFRVGALDGISFRYCKPLHRADGYSYEHKKGEGAFLQRLKPLVSCAD